MVSFLSLHFTAMRLPEGSGEQVTEKAGAWRTAERNVGQVSTLISPAASSVTVTRRKNPSDGPCSLGPAEAPGPHQACCCQIADRGRQLPGAAHYRRDKSKPLDPPGTRENHKLVWGGGMQIIGPLRSSRVSFKHALFNLPITKSGLNSIFQI